MEAFALFKLQQGSADEAIVLVARAAAQRSRSGSSEAFFREITDPAQAFHDRDMYVFALDANGTYLAFGGNRSKVGTRVQDIAGIDGQGLLDAIINQAQIEPGWVEYDITNPLTGRVQTKMSFVQQVDDWYLVLDRKPLFPNDRWPFSLTKISPISSFPAFSRAQTPKDGLFRQIFVLRFSPSLSLSTPFPGQARRKPA